VALNLADRMAVRPVILDRVKAAVINYALYLVNGTPTTAQSVWAKDALANPSLVADRVSYYVLNAPDFISSGSSITDAVLTGAVETAINTHMIS
jgi:hypothetical protein